jgi:integrase/recombinase XerD
MPVQAKRLSSKEIDLVFKILEGDRNKLLFAIGIYTGLRVGEIIRLKQSQVYTDEGVKNALTVQRLKKRGTFYSAITIHPKLRQYLKEHRKNLKPSEWLFPSSESVSGHLSREAAHFILSRAFKTLNIEGASTHSMRRSCLTALSKAGVPLTTIQEISGHSNMGQLRVYIETDQEDIKNAINMLKY